MAVELWTFEDAVEHVCDVFDLDNVTRSKRQARRAVLQAYRDLPNLHSWSYFYRRKVLNTSAPYSTGTVLYAHTGASSERLITLTGGTFPSWTARGKIIIDDVHYSVESNPSSTTLTLTENSNPGSDITTAATYQLYRSAYPLPSDFHRCIGLFDTEQSREVRIVSPDELQSIEGSYYRSPGTPWSAAIQNDGDYYGNLSIVFAPPPDAAVAYDLQYHARPRELVTEQYSTGTVSCSANSTTVSGSGTTFAAQYFGSVIRFSANGTDLPTSIAGVRASNLLNPFTYQRIVSSVATASSLTLDASMPTASSAVKYTISDPIDIEAGAMFTAFLRFAELEMARLTTRNDVPLREQVARAALLRAIEYDERQPPRGSYAGGYPRATINTSADST